MRENRTYGSEGGEPGDRAFLPPSELSVAGVYDEKLTKPSMERS